MNLIARAVPVCSFASVLTLLAYFSLYLLQMGSFADDPGVGWHLKTGELIRQSHSIPRLDPFLAKEHRPWIADQWLSDVVLSSLYDWGGWKLLYVALAGVWIVTFFGILFPALRNELGSTLASLGATLIAFKCAQIHFILRPVVFSICCFACVLVVVRKLSRRDSIPLRALLLPGVTLSTLFVLWSNVHPAFVLGLFVVLILPVSRFLGGSRNIPELVRVFGISVLCVVMTCINPYGFELHKSIIALGRSAYFLSLNSEWLPPSLNSFEGVTLLVLIVVLVVTRFVSPSTPKAVGVFDLVVTGFLTWQAFRSVRFLPFAVIAGAFPLGAALSSLKALRKAPLLRLTARCVQALDRYETSLPGVGLIAVLCAMGGVLGSGFMPLPTPLGPQSSRYPTSILEALKSDAPQGTVLASPDWGGFITANLYPSFKAVIDDRNTLIGEDLYREYFRSLDSTQTLSDLIQRFEVTHLIVPRKTSLGQELAVERKWPILLDDGKSLVVRVVRP